MEDPGMGFLQIREMATVISREDCAGVVDRQASGIHESRVRSYRVVRKIRYLLENNTAPAIVLELIELMTEAPGVQNGD